MNIRAKLATTLDNIFEDAQSYTGPMLPDDHLFEQVLNATESLFTQLLTEKREEINRQLNMTILIHEKEEFEGRQVNWPEVLRAFRKYVLQPTNQKETT